MLSVWLVGDPLLQEDHAKTQANFLIRKECHSLPRKVSSGCAALGSSRTQDPEMCPGLLEASVTPLLETFHRKHQTQAWSTLRVLRQTDGYEFKARLGYIGISWSIVRTI